MNRSQGLGPMPNATVLVLWVDPADGDCAFATVGYWLSTSQAHFAVMRTYVTMEGAGRERLKFRRSGGTDPNG